MSDHVDRGFDGDPASEHARWLDLHRDEATAAEEWLARALGDDSATTTPTTESPQPIDVDVGVPRSTVDGDGWRVETRPGGVVVAHHDASGAVVTGTLVLRSTHRGVRLRLLQYHYAIPGGVVAAGPPAPVITIESVANEPAMAQSVLDSIGETPAAGVGVPPMRIPPAMLRSRRRTDEFYRTVAALVHECRVHKIAYGPRLAADNHIAEGTVRSWVHEARRRGVLDAVVAEHDR